MDRPADRVGHAGALAGLVLAGALLAGCGPYKAYEGPPRAIDRLAIVRADPLINAGLPVQVILRSVDGRPVRATHSAVSVAPGEHRFLVDCWLAEAAGARRFEVAGTVDAGREYRLEAVASARSCDGVSLILRSP